MNTLSFANELIIAITSLCMACLSGSFAVNADRKEGGKFTVIAAAVCCVCTAFLTLKLVVG